MSSRFGLYSAQKEAYRKLLSDVKSVCKIFDLQIQARLIAVGHSSDDTTEVVDAVFCSTTYSTSLTVELANSRSDCIDPRYMNGLVDMVLAVMDVVAYGPVFSFLLQFKDSYKQCVGKKEGVFETIQENDVFILDDPCTQIV